jgi:hypothetical protein
MKKEDIIVQCNNLNIEELREVADFCNELADSLEREEEERVLRERP